MKKIFTSILFASAVLLAGAQTSSNNPVKNDPDAKKVLDAVSAKFKTYKSPQAAFTYKIENAQGKAISTKKGTVKMKGSRYRVSIPGMEIFSDGKTNWNYDKAANEVTVKDVDVNSDELSPQKLFTSFYDKDFLYKLNGEKKEAGKTLQEIEMTPTNKSRPFHKVYLWIDKATKTLFSARILEKTGNRYSYTINSFIPAVTIADADFVFNKSKYPGVEVVDLR
ncbi:MAG TPA: outer membrane lipoprotein carrier protein LolA [Chitinophagaceae bacterium]|nr:outer membrane lipoprotein carrier protein LolA [Chitinophagaceae bacterium]